MTKIGNWQFYRYALPFGRVGIIGAAGLSVQLCALLALTTSAIAQSASPSPSSSANSAIASPSARPLLRLGSESTDVAEIQAMLALLGFYNGPISGSFGEQTETAVRRFQQAANLATDGIVGASTWSRLLPTVTRVNAFPPSTQPTQQSANQLISTPKNPTVEADASQPQPRSPSASDTDTSSQVDFAASPDAESAPSVEFPVLRRGMRGAAVIGLQERLSAIGVYNGPIDGIFGAQTEAAVVATQRRLNLTQDGIVGSATWIAILDSTL